VDWFASCAAQAAAYHNDEDPAKAAVSLSVAPSPSVSYEEQHDSPTRCMAFFHLLSHQMSIYMTFVLVSLVIALAIVYNDTTDLQDDVVNNVRRECKDVVDALLVDNTSPPETTTLAAPVRTRFDKRVRACWRGCTRFSCSRVLVAVAVSVLRSPVCLPSCAPCVLHVRRTCRSL